MQREIVQTSFSPAMAEKLRFAALAASVKRGVVVSVQDLIRAFVDTGIDLMSTEIKAQKRKVKEKK